MEILNLDELAADQAYEFLFVVGPLLQRGGSACPSIRSPCGSGAYRRGEALTPGFTPGTCDGDPAP